jgi:hypothetical protein
MKRRLLLHEIAHARAGDKGNVSNVAVWVNESRFYEAVKAQLTAERLKSAFPRLIGGKVERYEIPHLHGLNFVMHEALEGGVNTSLNLDSHGKSWSYLLLGLEIEIDDAAQAEPPSSSAG